MQNRIGVVTASRARRNEQGQEHEPRPECGAAHMRTLAHAPRRDYVDRPRLDASGEHG
jgi:hypothetical protein